MIKLIPGAMLAEPTVGRFVPQVEKKRSETGGRLVLDRGWGDRSGFDVSAEAIRRWTGTRTPGTAYGPPFFRNKACHNGYFLRRAFFRRLPRPAAV